MINSFLRNNKWFDGDVIILCENLPDDLKDYFTVFKNVKFISPTVHLKQKLDVLCKAIPGFYKIIAQFYSLEIFHLSGYKKILFLDSDMIAIKDLSGIFERAENFITCRENCYYRDAVRNIFSYDAVKESTKNPDVLTDTFNSGFMLIDSNIISDENYQNLLEMITPELWTNKNTFHADQLVLNLYFRNKYILEDSRYNYRPKIAPYILQKENVDLNDAIIIHFMRQFKPWNFAEVLKTGGKDHFFLGSYEKWYKEFIHFLRYLHLAKKKDEYFASKS